MAAEWPPVCLCALSWRSRAVDKGWYHQQANRGGFSITPCQNSAAGGQQLSPGKGHRVPCLSASVNEIRTEGHQ